MYVVDVVFCVSSSVRFFSHFIHFDKLCARCVCICMDEFNLVGFFLSGSVYFTYNLLVCCMVYVTYTKYHSNPNTMHRQRVFRIEQRKKHKPKRKKSKWKKNQAQNILYLLIVYKKIISVFRDVQIINERAIKCKNKQDKFWSWFWSRRWSDYIFH